MKSTIVAFVIGLLLATVETSTQTPAPPAPQGRQRVAPSPPPPVSKPEAPAAQREREPPPNAVNVRIDVALIDEGGPQTVRENVTLTTVDGLATSVRSDADVGNLGPTILNVDATPRVVGMPPGKLQVRVAVDYLPKPMTEQPRGGRTRLVFAMIVDDGKTLVASNTSDPATDRRVRVEVTATILK
jgi:hypothetical protein